MNLIDNNYINKKDKELVELFISSSTTNKYILGINKFTRNILKHIEVDGVIDDFTRVQHSRKKEIFQIEDVPKNALILWTSTGSPLEVKKILDNMNFMHISYLSLYKYAQLDLLPPPFMDDFEKDFLQNRELYSNVYNLLADEKSKNIFTKVLNFKISLDYTFMEGFTNNHSEQYFDKGLIPSIENISFVDGGGYVGDTAHEVIKNFPNFKKIYLIEPIKENITIAKRKLQEHERIHFLEYGLSNEEKTLFFNEEKSFSALYGKGTQSVQVNRLDNLLPKNEPIDFIKLDIEGAEQSAIDGAAGTIKAYKPILAICIYHKAEDWYKIPQKVLAIESSYKIYLRHYMEGIYETVMYFIPQ